MIRLLLFNSLKHPTPILRSLALSDIHLSFVPFSPPHSSPFSTSGRRGGPYSRRRKRKPRTVDQYRLDQVTSSLPPRFTSPDLTSALSYERDPLICLHLLQWATHHPRYRPDPDHFLIVIKKLGVARLYVEMDSLASLALSLPSLSFSASLYNTLIYFYLQARRMGKAFHVYTVMRASSDPAVHPTIHTYNLLFTALLSRGGQNSYIHYIYMDTLSALFRQMIDSGVKPDILCLNALIKGYSQSLHLNDALRVFHQMVPVYQCEPDGCTYSYLVHGLCVQGRTKNALELYEEMKGKELVPDKRASNSIVSALAMEGEVAEAVRIMSELVRMGRVVDGITCRAVIGELGRIKGRSEAEALVWEMEERGVVYRGLRRELLIWIQDEFGDEAEWAQPVSESRHISRHPGCNRES